MGLIRSIIKLALMLALAGTLAEATGIIGREAVKAHQHPIGLVWLNKQLMGPQK